MIVWRIATETRKYAAVDLSGAGAAKHPGRWNDDAQPVLYAAPTIAMAVLETAAHIDDALLPLNRFLLRLEVPEPVWAAREERACATLPAALAAIPAGSACVKLGSEWLRSNRSAILLVPSVIVPEEWIVLINPAHPDTKQMTARIERAFEYDRLFRMR